MTCPPLPPSRRTVLSTAAWSAPAIVLASAAPAHAVSGGVPTMTVLTTRGDTGNGIGTVNLSLDPDPTTTPVPVTTYDDAGTTTTSFTKTGTDGTAGLYQLVFTSTTHPCPATITTTLTLAGYGTVMPAVLMAAPGTLDTTFTNPNLNAPAYAVAILPDGGLLAAGEFTTAGPDSTPYERLARFNADGTLDTTFTDPRLRPIYQVAVRGDGKILVVGNFTTAGPDNTPYGRLARLNLDGSLDTTFTNPNLNRPTYQLAVQPDEKVLVTGGSTTAGPDNTPYGRLARFNADGTLDTTFTDPNLNNTGYALAVQSDGKILVGGSFTTAGPDNTPYGRLARFHPDGTLDTTFTNPNLDGNVWDLAVQGDGSVLVTGTFNGAGPGNTTYGRLARFHPDGTLDTTFTNAGLNGYGKALAVQSDGKILVAGTFESAGPTGTHYGRLARFHPDGALDTTFTNPRLDADGNGLRLLGDGKILVPGRFSTAGTAGTASGYLARFHG